MGLAEALFCPKGPELFMKLAAETLVAEQN
jgi:hypothetical protein